MVPLKSLLLRHCYCSDNLGEGSCESCLFQELSEPFKYYLLPKPQMFSLATESYQSTSAS